MRRRSSRPAAPAQPLDAPRSSSTAETSSGAQGQRVLAFATRTLAADEQADLERPRGLDFLGLEALVDPPRPEAVAAVRAAGRRGSPSR